MISPLFLTEFLDLLSVIHTSRDSCILISGFNIHADNLADTRAKRFAFKQQVIVLTHTHHTVDLIISYTLDINIFFVTDLVSMSPSLCFNLYELCTTELYCKNITLPLM